MKYWYNSFGQIVLAAPDNDATSGFDSLSGIKNLVSESSVDISKYYVSSGELIPIGNAPSVFHTFNFRSKEWEVDYTYSWEIVKAKRNQLLSSTDWIVTQCLENGKTVPEEWKTYRQALRDITLSADPCNLEWPNLPNLY